MCCYCCLRAGVARCTPQCIKLRTTARGSHARSAHTCTTPHGVFCTWARDNGPTWHPQWHSLPRPQPTVIRLQPSEHRLSASAKLAHCSLSMLVAVLDCKGPGVAWGSRQGGIVSIAIAPSSIASASVHATRWQAVPRDVFWPALIHTHRGADTLQMDVVFSPIACVPCSPHARSPCV